MSRYLLQRQSAFFVFFFFVTLCVLLMTDVRLVNARNSNIYVDWDGNGQRLAKKFENQIFKWDKEDKVFIENTTAREMAALVDDCIVRCSQKAAVRKFKCQRGLLGCITGGKECREAVSCVARCDEFMKDFFYAKLDVCGCSGAPRAAGATEEGSLMVVKMMLGRGGASLLVVMVVVSMVTGGRIAAAL